MANYFLVNYSTLTAVNVGEIPETWGNITGLDKSRPVWMKRLTDVGYDDFGFLTYAEAIEEGISVASLTEMRELYYDLVWEKIKAVREKKKDDGVLVDGKWFHTDLNSKLQHLSNKDSAKDQIDAGATLTDTLLSETGQPIVWKCMSHPGQPLVFTPMTIQLALDVVSAIKAQEYTLHLQAEQKFAALKADVTPENYDYTVGWVSTFSDTAV